jgi:cobyrinic acid a,c-diamide synthase
VTPGHSIPRLVIAGTASGVGKTTVTAGIIAALRQRGLVVQSFKCGPDYIDPSYHALASGRACRNLDAWMLSEGQLKEGFARACAGADLAVVEGVMGVFDGADWGSDQGSTAHIARILQAPVVLVVDISGAARSAALAVAGAQRLDPTLRLCGVILNQAGSRHHADGCAQAIESQTGVQTLGWLSRDVNLEVPERHLGLTRSSEAANVEGLIANLGRAVAERFNLDAVLAQARDEAAPSSRTAAVAVRPSATSDGPLLAVARDEAFCFYYPENLELLEEQGMRLEFFSPVRGEAPSPEAAGVYFGGGYPELHGRALSENGRLWAAVRDLRARDAPIYAECGGFMVLTEGLKDTAGKLWPMAGLIPGQTEMSERLAALGYRWAQALQPNLLCDVGSVLRAHEFHYSHWQCDSNVTTGRPAWHVRGTRSQTPESSVGFVQGNLLASYLHVHFGQDPRLAQRFGEKLRAAAGVLADVEPHR